MDLLLPTASNRRDSKLRPDHLQGAREALSELEKDSSVSMFGSNSGALHWPHLGTGQKSSMSKAPPGCLDMTVLARCTMITTN